MGEREGIVACGQRLSEEVKEVRSGLRRVGLIAVQGHGDVWA